MNSNSPLVEVPAAAKSKEDCAANTKSKKPEVEANPEGEHINDDERVRGDYKSRYPAEVLTRIRWEAAFVIAALIGSLFGMIFTWRGDLHALFSVGCTECKRAPLDRYSYVFFAGVLGGALFGLKYLYKVVAHGYWNEDRAVWRVSSPLLAGGFAFAFGALANAGLFGFDTNHSHGAASFISLGFIAGYFADSASRKMQEVADILFGSASPRKPPDARVSNGSQ